MAHGVHPDKIIWVIPNDVWFMNRKYFTFDKDFVKNVILMMKSMVTDENKNYNDALLRLKANIRFRYFHYLSCS